MSHFDLSRVLASKRTYRQQLATRPLAEKLHLLDELYERALAIRHSTPVVPPATASNRVNESSARYASNPRPPSPGS